MQTKGTMEKEHYYTQMEVNILGNSTTAKNMEMECSQKAMKMSMMESGRMIWNTEKESILTKLEKCRQQFGSMT